MVAHADLCGSLHVDAVARKLSQVGQDNIRHMCGLVQTVCGVPVFHIVEQNNAVCEKRGHPRHVHLAGADALIGQIVRWAARHWNKQSNHTLGQSQILYNR